MHERVNFHVRAKGRNGSSATPETFLGKVVLKICSKFTGEHPDRSVISIKLQRNFVDITLRHGCSLLNIFRKPFLGKTPMEECFPNGIFKFQHLKFFLYKIVKKNVCFTLNVFFLVH